MPSDCIEVKNETNRRYYARHRERLAEEACKYRKENPDKISATKRRYYSKNREVVIGRVAKYYELNPQKRKKSEFNAHQGNLRFKYGIEVAEYNSMFLAQEGRCAICLKHQSEFKRRLHVDHDHATGAIRGLLCQHCNNVLGLMRDDAAALQRAVSYLQKVRE